jgi:mono/diheme cytochrome c family protein
MSERKTASRRGRRSNLRIGILAAAAVTVAVVLAALWLFVWDSDGPDGADATSPDLVERGAVLYQQHCASCHGANLEGQPNWRERDADGMLPAPPHDVTGHTWHHSDALLFDVTKLGSTAIVGDDYMSNMPGFAETLSDSDIWAILSYIKSTWPPDIQEIQSDLEDTRNQ